MILNHHMLSSFHEQRVEDSILAVGSLQLIAKGQRNEKDTLSESSKQDEKRPFQMVVSMQYKFITKWVSVLYLPNCQSLIKMPRERALL